MIKVFLQLLKLLVVIYMIFRLITAPRQSDKLYTPNLMDLTSPDFENNGPIPPKFTCQDENINPNLFISNTPENAESLVLIVDDPDATGGPFTHWLMWNINPSLSQILIESTPGVEGTNDYGKNKYNGPCPLYGTHRYSFRIYALNTILDLPPETKLSELQTAMKNHILDTAELIGVYQKQ